MLRRHSLVFYFIIILSCFGHAQEKQEEKAAPQDKQRPESLLTIASDPKTRSSEMTMKLRFKVYDDIFERLTFYDHKNMDIEFDLSSAESRKLFSEKVKFLREGVEYNVTFSIREYISGGRIYGILKDFQPAAIEKLP